MLRFGLFVLFMVVLLVGLLSVSANADDGTAQVPDAATYVLAPTGFAAVIAVRYRRQRRMERIRRSVGLGYRLVKRSLDVVMAASILLLTFPVFLIIAAVVAIDSPGPILYKRMVLGKHGRMFGMLKFRTMVVGAESILQKNAELRKEYYVNCKLKNDPRVTKIGRFLRKTSLDELPQLINILFGDMTFVGPRPIASDEVEMYGPNVERFKMVTPGVTGLWQTSGRSETSYEKRVEMDMLYIENRSICMDVWILLATVPSVLLKRGAF